MNPKVLSMPDQTRTLQEAEELFMSDASNAQLSLPLDDLPTVTKELVDGFLTMMDLATPELVVGALLPVASYAACLELEVIGPFSKKPIVTAVSVLLSAPTGGGKSFVCTKMQQPIKQAADSIIETLNLRADSLDCDVVAPPSFSSVYPVVTEATVKGLARHAEEFYPALFMNADAGNFLEGYSMREEAQSLVSFMCSCWSGEAQSSKRADAKDDISIPDPLMPIYLATQPSVFQRFYANDTAKGTGLHARFLPIISDRKLGGDVPSVDDLMKALAGSNTVYSEPPESVQDYYDKLYTTSITYAKSNEEVEKQRIELAEDGETRLMLAEWKSKYVRQRKFDVEAAGNGMFARLEEHVYRLAAVFVWLEGETKITAEILNAAIVWAEHFFAQYSALHGLRSVAVAHSEAYDLLDSLLHSSQKEGNMISYRKYQSSLSAARRKPIKEMRTLLWTLQEEGFIDAHAATPADIKTDTKIELKCTV